MAAQKGNKHAVGNKGGRPYSAKNRKKAATLKGLVLDWAIKILKASIPKKPYTTKANEEEKLGKWAMAVSQLKTDKTLVISKILPTCVSREIDLSSEPGEGAILVINLGEKEK